MVGATNTVKPMKGKCVTLRKKAPAKNALEREAGLLQDDIIVMYEKQHLTDVEFIFPQEDGSEKVLKAHKAIIASRSPVLATMFSSTLSEGSSSKVTIADASYSVFDRLLRFLYGGKLEIVSEQDLIDAFYTSNLPADSKIESVDGKSYILV